MWIRSLLAIAVLFASTTALQAAQVTRFVVKCVKQQEVSPDDIYLAATRDAQPVPWGKDHQNGTSTGKSVNMKTGDVLTLDTASLAELKFQNTLQIVIKEKDVTADEVFGTVTILPNDGTKNAVFKSNDFEYHVEYMVEK